LHRPSRHLGEREREREIEIEIEIERERERERERDRERETLYRYLGAGERAVVQKCMQQCSMQL
jgi:hypothetical protein